MTHSTCSEYLQDNLMAQTCKIINGKEQKCSKYIHMCTGKKQQQLYTQDAHKKPARIAEQADGWRASFTIFVLMVFVENQFRA